MGKEKQLAKVGSFCPNEECAHYGLVGAGNIIKYGFSKQDRQRYRCKSCERAFNENHGTLFYRRRKAAKEILECLALLAKGTTPSALAEAKGYKPETIMSWLLEAARHSEQVTAALLHDYQVSASQIDGLWSFVKHKGTKKGSRRAKKPVPSGVAPSLRSTAAYG